ncbi:hypothetical protein H2198_008232 [Neophaeococcomyces mojaviensis]|uniref:Uncharacterized protein n=1 Tax=Neophaeococcomyces mojaviensis TaxID=3383035 RepID=A0ACC2ZXP8_9EURO|nr:hypothetical protein H2198_008232 [Knufia sp. JES_112]
MATEANEELLTCPFCDYREKNDYQMLLHVEVMHTEDGEESPFALKDELAASRQSQDQTAGASQSEPSGLPTPAQSEFVECPYHCGEQVPADELQFHTDFHVAENMANEDATVIDITNNFSTDISNAIRNHDQVLSEWQTPVKEKEKRWTSSIRDMFSTPRFKLVSPAGVKVKGNEVRRLDKAELGPYANERRMPSWLVRLLEDGAEVTVSNKIGHDGRIVKVEIISNETPNLIPVLARLSKLDRNISRAFYCDPAVRHVAKLPKEGGFCGYRNTQMLISYIRDAKAPGHEHFDKKRLPSILKLQDMIEEAWDQGYNTAGRKETGGIRMTRKYIGTPEAQALLLSLGINAEAQAFSAKDKVEAYRNLMEAVWNHFESGVEYSNTDKVVVTDKPPLYFQHRGHSLTIVGIELDVEERPNLVVFDPTYNPSQQLRRLALNNKLAFTTPTPGKLMKAHRRDERYLGRYKEFEMIKVNGPV